MSDRLPRKPDGNVVVIVLDTNSRGGYMTWRCFTAQSAADMYMAEQSKNPDNECIMVRADTDSRTRKFKGELHVETSS